jgi:HD-like signal output (HDOD) protein/prolyl-tRNA editing enzyme YbaK/EbsC (Cys-tRNA(Pro) deacylase)
LSLSARLQQFFARKGIQYRELSLAPVVNLDAAIISAGVTQDNVVRGTLMIDISGVVMMVHTFTSTLDMDAVREATGRQLQPLTARQATRLFQDCDAGFFPPAGAAYELQVLVDNDVDSLSRAYVCGGRRDSLVVLDRDGIAMMLQDAPRAHLVIRGKGDNDRRALTLGEVADKLQRLYRLPPMPALALRILRLTADTESSARELADLIEYDPSLTAQIMRYARSALFNYPGEIQSVQEAVTRVLGFDRVAHIALGIASVRAFDVPRQGVLGMDSFWRHSLYCAFLCQEMAPKVGADKGLAYLCGLLHNFGLLLIGHLFPGEFRELNELRESNPEASMQSLEHEVFGAADQQESFLSVGHGAIGGILHKLWQLPEPVVKSAGVHQQHDYHGEHENYVLMVQLANALLKPRGIGDEFNADDSADLAARLRLSDTDLAALEESLDIVGGELDQLAGLLAA